MEENMNTNEVVETYDTTETDVVEVHSNAKPVIIGAAVATTVTACLYGAYRLGGRIAAKVKRNRLKKEAEDEIARARAFESYDETVQEIHGEMESDQ